MDVESSQRHIWSITRDWQHLPRVSDRCCQEMNPRHTKPSPSRSWSTTFSHTFPLRSRTFQPSSVPHHAVMSMPGVWQSCPVAMHPRVSCRGGDFYRESCFRGRLASCPACQTCGVCMSEPSLLQHPNGRTPCLRKPGPPPPPSQLMF